MKFFFLHLGLLLFLLAFTGSCKEARRFDSPELSSVWKVQKGSKVGYLGGTIHLLRDTDYPLPSPFQKAYDASKKVYFELSPHSKSTSTVQAEMFRLGTYPEGDDFTKHVSPETYLKVKNWASSRGIPMDRLYSIKPWFLALTVATTEYQILGADPSRGVDRVFGEQALKDGKPTAGLETESQQILTFAELSEEKQEEFLLQTFEDAENIREDFEELIASWRSGDEHRISRYLFRNAEKYADLLEIFLFKRNREWMPSITKSIEAGEDPLFLVGTAHLYGENGLLSLLKAQGFNVEQLKP